jgi:hypothetical protein
MRAIAVHRHAAEKDLIGRILCHDVRGDRNEIVLRKGHALRDDDIPILLASPWDELHLLELQAGDVGQREAGRRLAESIFTEGMQLSPAGHRHVLRATRHGLLKIDAAALTRINSIRDIAVFTLRDNEVVTAGETVAEAQITPLAIGMSALEEAERIARQQAIVRLLPFVPREVVVWMRNDRFLRPLTARLGRFGCLIREVIDLPRDAQSIRESFERNVARATLFIVSGSNALDPLDPVFVALERVGARMQRIGLPMHPGTLLWIATLARTTIIGLPSCGLGPQRTSFDLILPRILAEGEISDEAIADMAEGGILRRVNGAPASAGALVAPSLEESR